MFLKYIAILVLLSKDILAQNCPLTALQMDKRWIYAIRSTSNKWELLHTDYIVDQQTLYLICNGNVTAVQLLCNRGVLPTIPQNARCEHRTKATVTSITNDIPCSRKGGQMYEIRYTVDGDIMPLYRVCYSQANEAVLYARHLAYGFNLPTSNYHRPQFTLSGVVSRGRADSFEGRNIYSTFVRLLGPNQTYVPSIKDSILERGHLANSLDFLTYDQMDETFKYVNVMPQFRAINRSNWKRLEIWIHNLPESMKYAEVVTGTYGIVSLEHSQTQAKVPIYLMANNKNPVPMWMYKVVKYDNRCYAFITLNNQFNTTGITVGTLCRSIACPAGLNFSSDPTKGITYCCDYNHFFRVIGRQAELC